MLNFVFRVPLYHVFLGGGSSHDWLSCQSWCRSDPLIFDFSLDLPLFCIGTFSVDILVWGRPHKCVIEIGLFACLISANQSFAWPKQQLTIFMVWESIVHNCLGHRSLSSSFFSRRMMTYSNYMILLKLMLGDNVVKISSWHFLWENIDIIHKLWHYKIKNTNSVERYLVGIFIISFLISETVESSLTAVCYTALFSRLTSDWTMWWAVHLFLFPKYHEGQGLFQENNLYLCVILFTIKFVVVLKFRCCLMNLYCSRSWIWVRLCVVIGVLMWR